MLATGSESRTVRVSRLARRDFAPLFFSSSRSDANDKKRDSLLAALHCLSLPIISSNNMSDAAAFFANKKKKKKAFKFNANLVDASTVTSTVHV